MTDFYTFNNDNVSRAPSQHGIYILYQGNELIYIGRAIGEGVTIQSRLSAHLRGEEGRCTQSATKYQREILSARAAQEREVNFLNWHKQQYGRLPRCNQRVG